MSPAEVQRMDELARRWQAQGSLGEAELAEYQTLSRRHSAEAGRQAAATAGTSRTRASTYAMREVESTPGDTYRVHPPERRGQGYEVVGGSGGGAGGLTASSGGPVQDVNIVSPVPLRVWVENLGRMVDGAGGGGGSGGGRGRPGAGGPGDPDAISNVHPAAGLSLQDVFSRQYGSYTAGYPIRNLFALGKHAREFGRNAAGAASRFDDGVLGGAGKRFGRFLMDSAANSRLGRGARGIASGVSDLYGRAGGKLADALDKRSGWVGKKAARLVRGRNVAAMTGRVAAGAGAAGSAGSGGGVAAIAAAGGPVTATVGAIVALGAAAVIATQEVYAFARAQEDEIRRVSENSGAAAGGLANLDVRRLERDIAMGQSTETTSERLLDGLDKFEQALHPIEVAATKVANLVGGALLETIGAMLEPVGKGAEYLSEILDYLTDSEPKRRDSMAGALDAMASRDNWEAAQGMKRPQYPGAAPDPGGNGYWNRRG